MEKVGKQQKYDGATSHRFILSVKESPLDEQKGYLIASSPIWLTRSQPSASRGLYYKGWEVNERSKLSSLCALDPLLRMLMIS